MTIYIKNMVSESCKYVVRLALEDIGIKDSKIELGEVKLNRKITNDEKNLLKLKLNQVELEIVEKENGVLVDKIKASIVDYVYNSEGKPSVKFSVFLSNKLDKKYGYLANHFAEVEKNTIEQYLVALRVERVKEMIIFGEHNLSEIALKLHYSSVAHLSKQFKKMTGMTPSQFKALEVKARLGIHEI